MEIKLNIAKKHLYILMAFVLAVVGLGIVIAFNTESPETFGHSAGEMMVTIDGAQKTLQSAIDDGSLGGGGGTSEGNRYAIYTSSNTFTVPAGVTKVLVEMVGGGGGGCGKISQGGLYGGGGGGAYLKSEVTVTAGQSISVVVGEGGIYCGAGGASSFGSLSVSGGAGAHSGYSGYAGPGGPLPSQGMIRSPGGDGGQTETGGIGGNSVMGIGAGPETEAGTGAGGSYSGGAGVVIVYW